MGREEKEEGGRGVAEVWGRGRESEVVRGRMGTEKMLLCVVIFCLRCVPDCPQGPNSGADCVSCAPCV